MSARQVSYEKLERAVRKWVRKADLSRAIAHCEKELAALPRTEYHQALGRSWLRQTLDASRWLGGFCRTTAKALSIRALYCEMNLFEINPDEWYVDAFAYDFFGEPRDLGWLVGWKKTTGDRNRLVLRGMRELQALFARDYGDEPPADIRPASEVVILLLTLRMQELMHAAALRARQSGQLPEDLPVLAASHDSDLICFSYGRVKPRVTRPEPARPVVSPPPRAGARLGIYQIGTGWDEFHNSLPWDGLVYAREKDEEKYTDQLYKVKPLARNWRALRVKLHRRKWRCDLIQLYPHWAVNERARAALTPLLGKTVEFLPLRCAKLPGLWVLHPLRHIDLAAGAVHNGKAGHNMTVIHRYAFEAEDLKGKHLFGVKQVPGSAARAGGHCFRANYVSEEFKGAVTTNGLQGIVFEKVFSYRP
jgi:hypothetical protein